MDLAVDVYRAAENLPKDETYGLGSQMKRSAASVPANIAEGYARSTRKDYANFIAIAKGSLMETETFILLANRLGYIDDCSVDQLQPLVTEISKMLTALRTRLLKG